MAGYITASDLALALGNINYLTLYDEDNDGVANSDLVAQDITLAEAQVDSQARLAFGGVPSDPTNAHLLRCAALEYAKSCAYNRHPEYARTSGKSCYQMAEGIMKSVIDSTKLERGQVPRSPQPSNPTGYNYNNSLGFFTESEE